MLRVPRPRVESVRRFAAGRATPGDQAVVRVGPGLLALLEHPVAGQPFALGAGYHGRYNAPLGLAIAAALAVVEPATPEGSAWLGREATVEWLGLPSPDDTLSGEARLTALSERDALFSITARTERGVPLLRGDFLLVLVAGGRPVGFPLDAAAARAASLSDRARERRAAAASSAPGARLRSAPTVLTLGRSADVIVELTAPPAAGSAWSVTARPPAAAGLSVEPPFTHTVTLEPGASATLTFTVRADRPDAINDGRPWTLELHATTGDRQDSLTANIAVPDADLLRAVDSLDVTDETTPTLVTWTAPDPSAADLARRTLRFPVRLLGRGIRVDAAHPADVTVAPPQSLEPAAIARMTVVQGGQALATGTTTVSVTLTDRDTPIDLEVELTSRTASQTHARFAASAAPFLSERGEGRQPDLLRLRPPRAEPTAGVYRVSPDVVRLLLNPVAGHGEPLGRRMHPLSGLGVGASLTAAFALAGDPAPAEPTHARATALWIRWLALPDLDLDLEARARLESNIAGDHTIRVEVFDGTGKRANESEVVVADASSADSSAAAGLLARRRIERKPTPALGPSASGSTLNRLKTRLESLWHRLNVPRI